MKCSYTFIKGKQKGETCDKNVNNNNIYCNRHLNTKIKKCSICLTNGKLITVCENGHSFHKNCITNWGQFKDTCPVCRYKLFDKFIDKDKINEKYNTEIENQVENDRIYAEEFLTNQFQEILNIISNEIFNDEQVVNFLNQQVIDNETFYLNIEI
jgi:hypothetical protein